jgi:SCY1-like protein 1
LQLRFSIADRHSELDAVSDDFPEDYFKMKVLPELLKSVEFGGGGPKVFAAVLKIASKLSEDEYEAKLIPVIVRLFNSPDRAMRVCLLDNLPLMIHRFSQKDVSTKIFPPMVTGFSDVAPIVREQTVKAVLTIVGKLTDRIVNGELLRYLAKTANDEQPGIRTNTTICLGKIAKNLGTSSRSKILVAAYTRSLRDPFVHARNAALMAMSATIDVFSDDDCANKILPSLCPCLLDKEKYESIDPLDHPESDLWAGSFETRQTKPWTSTSFVSESTAIRWLIQLCQPQILSSLRTQHLRAWATQGILLGLAGQFPHLRTR